MPSQNPNTNIESIDQFYQELKQLNSEIQIWNDYPKRFAMGTDASFYRLIPQLVVQVDDEEQVQQVIRLSKKWQIAITFRAAGTSLSGQAITDSVLIILGPKWNHLRIEDGAEIIHLKPGVIGTHANQALAPYGRKIGPDPASINTCKIGGIAANNASGMCCGTQSNSYQTLAGMRLVLADGSILDTRDPESIAAFKTQQSDLLNKLDLLGQEVKSNQKLSDLIRHKFRIKNTTGYSLNALVDYSDPIEILTHLMIGSEGTLGFIAEISYRTVEEGAFKAASLVCFPDVITCCEAVIGLSKQPVSAVELVDSAGLKVALGDPSVANLIEGLPEQAAAILVDVHATSEQELEQKLSSVSQCLDQYQVIKNTGFSTEPKRYQNLWAFRKGLFPAVGAVRDTGTTVIIEDVAFPIESLAQGVLRLQQCFDQHGYDDALIFGHALEGNVHFVFSQAFSTAEEIQKYDRFMQDIGQLVAVEFGGSLKAEHGTGRNMAPFVELEWGADAYRIMQNLKGIIDPDNRLNPGVILSTNPEIHLENLKGMAAADDIVDKCIECGFCEPACPSRNLTYTPRQRIAMLREIARINANGGSAGELASLEKAYFTEGLDSCAATGMCAERCPVGINTGELVKAQRQALNASRSSWASWAENHIGGIVNTSRLGLGAAQVSRNVLGKTIVESSAKVLRKLSGNRTPLWTDAMPQVAKKITSEVTVTVPQNAQMDYDFIYWPSCVSQVMGPARSDTSQLSQQQVLSILAERAGLKMLIPDGLNSLCCGQPFLSKGFPDHAQRSKDKLINHLQQYAKEGVPVVSDTSPCAARAQNEQLEIQDSLEFIANHLLPKLKIKPVAETIALHVPCTAKRNKQTEYAIAIVSQCAQDYVLPADIECCGFAGDKGFTQPELNESALATLPKQVESCDRGYSSSRTCEIGLSTYGGISYQSLLYLVEEASRS